MKTAQKETKPTKVEGDTERHFGNFRAALKYFYENGVRVSVRPKRGGFTCVFSGNPQSTIRNPQ
jgi:hypothetical protein